jgi:hypothetical protein
MGDAAEWTSEHDGYLSLKPSAWHRRCVLLDRASRAVDIIDEIGSGHELRMAFHLGPDIHVELDGACAMLSWPGVFAPGAACLTLPQSLRWSLHQGETDPILGWYSSGLGRRTPAFTLIGCGSCAPGEPLATRLEFLETSMVSESAFARPAL